MKKISLEKLSQLVIENRKRLGLTQEDLGDITGINRQLIGRIESMKFLPSLMQLEVLLNKLNIEFNSIVEEETADDIFLAMKGAAITPEEKQGVEKMISMMLCLRKHEVLRRKLYD